MMSVIQFSICSLRIFSFSQFTKECTFWEDVPCDAPAVRPAGRAGCSPEIHIETQSALEGSLLFLFPGDGDRPVDPERETDDLFGVRRNRDRNQDITKLPLRRVVGLGNIPVTLV